jgi:hypothetical protein
MASIRRRGLRISSPASLPIWFIGQRTTTLELDPRIRNLRSSGKGSPPRPRSPRPRRKTKTGCATSPSKWDRGGVIRVYGVEEDGLKAFTDFGVDTSSRGKAGIACKRSSGSPFEWRPECPLTARPSTARRRMSALEEGGEIWLGN